MDDKVHVTYVYVHMYTGDSSKLHDHNGGAAGPAAGYRCGKRKTGVRRREEPTHTAVCSEQEVKICIVNYPCLVLHTKFEFTWSVG